MVMENDGVRVDSASISDRGLSDKRPQNEDSFLEMNRCGIFAVADGVGGAQAGDVASQMAVEILGEAFANRPDGVDAEEVMRSAVQQANSAIYQMALELPQLSSMATTIVALHLSGNIATIGHVGDSRLYRVDRDGNLHRETEDHSMVAEEVRAGRMTEEQAENHPSRNIISRALGAEPTVDVDLKTIMIEPGTAFLICSDGITRHVGDQEIKGVLTFGGGPADICEYRAVGGAPYREVPPHRAGRRSAAIDERARLHPFIGNANDDGFQFDDFHCLTSCLARDIETPFHVANGEG